MYFAGCSSHWSWKLCNSIKNWATTKSTARYTRETGTTWIIPFTNCFNNLSCTQRIFTYLNTILSSDREHEVQWKACPMQWGTDGDERLSKCSTWLSRTARCCCRYSHAVWGGVGSSPSARHVCTAQGGAKQRNKTQSLHNSFTAILDPKNNSHV